ncbi:MAG: orn [Fibrobacteria bacterium]|nr:orn [Fibrobacteria bacterium]
MQNGENRLAWIDLEMTGLNPEKDVILEIATLVTDSDLNILAEGPVFAIQAPEEALAAMDEWNQRQHKKSGLLDRVRASAETMATAQAKTLEFFAGHLPAGKVPLCGNSVWQDRRFLVKHMPALDAFFHYRILDVSSVKEIARRWYPEVPAFKKGDQHLALADILDSVKELRYYREKIFAASAAGAPPTSEPGPA